MVATDGLDVLGSERGNCRDRREGTSDAADKRCKVFSMAYVHMSWPIRYPPRSHAGLGHVVLATKILTGSLTKMINYVDNGRGLAVRSKGWGS